MGLKIFFIIFLPPNTKEFKENKLKIMWNYIKHLLGCNSNGFYRVKYTFVISEFEMIIKKKHLILTTWREKRFVMDNCKSYNYSYMYLR